MSMMTESAVAVNRAVAADLFERLRVLGYVPGVPGHLAGSTIRADWSVCREAVCPGCGRLGLDYRPMHRGPRYRMLMVCPACSHCEEG